MGRVVNAREDGETKGATNMISFVQPDKIPHS